MPMVPIGSEQIAAWAYRRGLSYQATPDETWFRSWEPFDTITPPSAYGNACSWTHAKGQAVVVEPWYGDETSPPLDRTLLGFASDPTLRFRASARAGEHFVTRVAFLENKQPPKVLVGDAVWDEHVATFGWSAEEAEKGFHRRLRRLLAGWGFQGHLELRKGGLACHFAGLVPVARDYERMLAILRDVVNTAANYPT
ncbi:MAG: hypothetical protein IPK82_39465 [Polyangiaceae bacterium]|nr:hypothetical protein [Polyangiaceae bacterium]